MGRGNHISDLWPTPMIGPWIWLSTHSRPMRTWTHVVQVGVGAIRPTIQIPPRQEAWMEVEEGCLVDNLCGTSGPTWSMIRIPQLEGDPEVTLVVVDPVWPTIPCHQIWEAWNHMHVSTVSLSGCGAHGASWCQIWTVDPVVGPLYTIDIRFIMDLCSWKPSSFVPKEEAWWSL